MENNTPHEVAIIEKEADLEKNISVSNNNISDNNENTTENINKNENNNNIIKIPEDEDEEGEGELTLEEFNRIKQVQREAITRTKKYAEVLNDNQMNSNDEFLQNIINKNDKKEKNNNNNNSNIETSYENDFYNNYKVKEEVNPNKERKFGSNHIILFHKGEPFIMLGPDIKYYVWIVPIVSFLSVCIYSLKNNSNLQKFIFSFAYLFFVITYTILLVQNPGIPTNKNKIDFAELQKNYRQCDVCGCISLKNGNGMTLHCQECDVCVENFDHHCPFATKCIGRGTAIFFKLWLVSILILFLAAFVYLIA